MPKYFGQIWMKKKQTKSPHHNVVPQDHWPDSLPKISTPLRRTPPSKKGPPPKRKRSPLPKTCRQSWTRSSFWPSEPILCHLISCCCCDFTWWACNLRDLKRKNERKENSILKTQRKKKHDAMLFQKHEAVVAAVPPHHWPGLEPLIRSLLTL